MEYALFPDIAFPVVVVTARSFVDSDTRSTETDVTGPLEAWLRTIDGLSEMRSLTYPGLVSIQLNFAVGSDLEKARKTVEDTIRAADVGRYQLQKLQAIEQAKMQAALRHGMTPSAAESIARYMEARANPEAKTPPLIYTVVTPVNLNEAAVSTYTLTTARSKTASVAELDTLSELAEQRVAPALRAIPGVLRVDVFGASAHGKYTSVVRYDGEPAVAVTIIKNAKANTLKVADAADAAIAALRDELPTVRLTRASTQADYIREASHATTDALGLATLLSIFVIWPFLRDVRATLISALAIPTSLLGTALVMYAFGFNLETITLLALALVVGVIVDDAIVAVENIVRHVENGDTPVRAARRTNAEIGRTLTAATLTIVAVFLPIGMMSGTLGQFFRPFGITASAAVLFSLLVARSLSPAMAATLLRKIQAPRRSALADEKTRYPLYVSMLRWSLAHRKRVVFTAWIAFIGGLAIIPFIPKGFIPHLDRGEFHVIFSAPPNASLPEMKGIAAKLERTLFADSAVQDVYTTIATHPNEPNAGLLDVRLQPKRDATTLSVENRVRPHLPILQGVRTSVEDVPFVGTQEDQPFNIVLLGDDPAKLRSAGRTLESRLRKDPEYVDIRTTGLSDEDGFIQHVDGRRSVTITADLGRGVQIGDATDKATAIARNVVPPGVSIDLGGTSAATVSTFSSFGGTLALSVIAILVVLLSLFQSWLDPLVIAVALPLSVIGALLALWITRADFGLISLMGIVFLFGLVNKNAILLVDAIKRKRANGLTRVEAVITAGSERLRPILMTTTATILGMTPIALGMGAGAELRQPMAVAIIGGLITSTALSLLVVPVVYTLFDDLRAPKRTSMNPFSRTDINSRVRSA